MCYVYVLTWTKKNKRTPAHGLYLDGRLGLMTLMSIAFGFPFACPSYVREYVIQFFRRRFIYQIVRSSWPHAHTASPSHLPSNSQTPARRCGAASDAQASRLPLVARPRQVRLKVNCLFSYLLSKIS
jgi:hypothetical protein